MRYLILVVLFAFLTGIDRGHYYYTGTLQYIDSDKIIVDEKEYNLNKRVEVLKRYKSGRAFYEGKIKLRNINAGDKVTLKLIAKDVIQIVREDY